MAERPTYNRVIMVQLHVPAPDRRCRYARANRAAGNPDEAMSVHKIASMQENKEKFFEMFSHDFYALWD